jgi:hypothetical protein
VSATNQSPGAVVGSVLYLLGLIGLCVALSVACGSPWPGLLCFAGLVTLHVVASRATQQQFDAAFVAMWMGAGAISVAGTMGEYGGRWLWAVPWVLAGLLLLSVGVAARGVNAWASQGGLALGVWSLAWAFVGPMWLYGLDQQQTQQWMLDIARQWWLVLLIGLVVVSTLLAWASSRSPRAGALGAPHTPAGPDSDHAAFEQMLRDIEAQVARDEQQRELDRQHDRGRVHAHPGSPPAERDANPAMPDLPGIDSQPPGFGATVLAPDAAGEPLTDDAAREHGAAAGARGNLLYATSRPVVDAVLTPDGAHYLVLEDGTMARWQLGTLSEVPTVSVDRPVGAAAVGSEVVVAGRSGALAEVHDGSGSPHITWHRVDATIGAFALNPFGTIVALAPVRRHDVIALLLGPDTVQTLATDVDGTSALAFSADGLVLAMGMRTGRVVLLNMSTRQSMATLEPPTSVHSSVAVLQPCPGGGWVAGYHDGAVARWDESLRLVGTTRMPHPVTRLAVGSSSIALGCADGRVVTVPLDLSEVLRGVQVDDTAIVGLAFGPDEGTLVVTGHGGEVRRAVP